LSAGQVKSRVTTHFNLGRRATAPRRKNSHAHRHCLAAQGALAVRRLRLPQRCRARPAQAPVAAEDRGVVGRGVLTNDAVVLGCRLCRGRNGRARRRQGEERSELVDHAVPVRFGGDAEVIVEKVAAGVGADRWPCQVRTSWRCCCRCTVEHRAVDAEADEGTTVEVGKGEGFVEPTQRRGVVPLRHRP